MALRTATGPLEISGAQRFSRNQLGDDVGRMLVEPHVVNRHDIGMVERRRQPGFLLEAPPAFFVAGQRFGEDLERYLPAHPHIERAVNLAHPARA